MGENERPGWLQRAADETTEKVIESLGDILQESHRAPFGSLSVRVLTSLRIGARTLRVQSNDNVTGGGCSIK